MKEILNKIGNGNHLTHGEAASVMRTIMEGGASDAQIAAFLIALKLRGVTAAELHGFAEVMREKAVKVAVDDPDAVDLCGTGGDGAGTFNISTVASFIVAGAGATVAKHGNRSVSSSCGSADVLRALGVNIDLPPERAGDCINAVGIGFLFAPLFHPAMKYAAAPRRELGMKTCFNLLGPLTNPAGVRRQLAGAFDLDASAIMAEVFLRLGAVKVLVVTSHDGLDEVSLNAPTSVAEVNGAGKVVHYDIPAPAFGLPLASPARVPGGTAGENAALALGILRGARTPHRDYAVANAALALVAAGRARTVDEGVGLAAESLDAGRALDKLNRLISYTTA